MYKHIIVLLLFLCILSSSLITANPENCIEKNLSFINDFKYSKSCFICRIKNNEELERKYPMDDCRKISDEAHYALTISGCIGEVWSLICEEGNEINHYKKYYGTVTFKDDLDPILHLSKIIDETSITIDESNSDEILHFLHPKAISNKKRSDEL